MAPQKQRVTSPLWSQIHKIVFSNHYHSPADAVTRVTTSVEYNAFHMFYVM